MMDFTGSKIKQKTPPERGLRRRYEPVLAFDGFTNLSEVRQGRGVALHFGVHDVTGLIDYEHRTLSDIQEAQLFGDNAGVLNFEGFNGHAVEVRNERHLDVIGFSPSFLSEGAIDRNRDDIGTEGLVVVEVTRDFAKFFRAGTRESEGEEQNDGLTLADIATQRDVD